MTPDSRTAEPAPSRRSRRAAQAADGRVDRAAERPLSRREVREREQASAAVAATIDEARASDYAAPLARAVPAQDGAEAPHDAFAAAAAALNFTGEQAPIRVEDEAEKAPAPTRRSHASTALRTPFRRFAGATASLASVGVVALLAVGTALPLAASALEPAATTETAAAETDPVASAESELQAYVSSEDVAEAQLMRVEGYEAATFSEMAEDDGISTSGAFFENDPTADIQWPFAVGTSMSSPYGYRWGRLHEGIDFTPGDGAPVQAVADGVVRIATEAGGAYGVNVYIDHVIDGQVVTSHYAHMQYGSLRVTAGQTVEVGDVIGLTGNTGRSYGAHMHFEIRIGGTAIDPLPWLETYANTHYSDDEAAEVATAEADQLGAEVTEAE
ncbi:M23 family metallopeptidase [Microbacterium sp. ZXX196]|uniref:M23 family metallopeptidase n=1 Tax=Microbacterium sp. ZXX196 TaxID=2609291 RepID=UPI0012B973EF|nr:M23 family metallopeptidase [Microbacterium sp. ZXX196]MTE23501.1 peptidoglycan DD-metalloendopeptidase family protein [Microbacterium sp. ZXX196]